MLASPETDRIRQRPTLEARARRKGLDLLRAIARTILRGMSTPPEGTVERWAFDYISSAELSHKRSPPAPPERWEEAALPRRLERPGRPPELVPATRRTKTPSARALARSERRAQVLHGFMHHELQAAELMAWAILAFPTAPLPFRRGLLAIARDELRHLSLYERELERLGSRFGAFPINDWFWRRVPQAMTPLDFVATMGMGLEGANLDHAHRFAERFRAAGDLDAARVQELIAAEEVPHVAFALHWFQKLSGEVDFDRWRRHLPVPLTPLMMRGLPLNLTDRRRAGFTDSFLDELTRWNGESSGC